MTSNVEPTRKGSFFESFHVETQSSKPVNEALAGYATIAGLTSSQSQQTSGLPLVQGQIPAESHAPGQIKDEPLTGTETVKDDNVLNNCESQAASAVEEGPVIDITINNVVSTFKTRCHLDLRKVALNGKNVEYKREQGMISMKLRKPYTTASIWSSGKITCTGATSEADAKIACRRFARQLQKIGFERVKFCGFRVVNVLGTCSFPWGIRIAQFSSDHPRSASYEPELHPGVTYRVSQPKATMKIFSTGSVTITAPCVRNVEAAVEHIYPILVNYQMEKAKVSQHDDSNARLYITPAKRRKLDAARQRYVYVDEEEDALYSSTSDEDYLSDESLN